MVAVLAHPIIPSYLYRYRSLGAKGKFLDRELDAINKGHVWCSSFRQLNDPMEGFYSPSVKLRTKDEFSEIARGIYQRKTNIGIAALSDTYDNELMWTHYADEYRGMCIEYDAQRLFDKLPHNCTLARVGYVNEPISVSKEDSSNFDNAALRILSQKKSPWAYEREWRILGPMGRVVLSGTGPVVSSLRLGSRMDSGLKTRILQEFRGTHIDIYEMAIDGYTHKWQLIQEGARRQAEARNKASPKKRKMKKRRAPRKK